MLAVIATRPRVASIRIGSHESKPVARSRPRGAFAAISALLMLCAVGPAYAIGLVDAYNAALGYDPAYAGAMKSKEASDANLAIGRSYLLPSLSANYATYRSWTDTTYFGQQYGAGGSLAQQYHAYSEGVSLRQPLINLDGIARYRYGKAQAQAGEAILTDRTEDLLVRVVAAYTDAVFSLDQLALASAETKAMKEQLASNEAMFKKGEGTRTDILETRAELELARADLTDARDTLDNASHALEAITGLSATLDVSSLDRLSDSYHPELPSPANYEQWREIALDSNAELLAERHSVEAARQQLKITQAGFYPRVDLVGNIGKNQSNTVDTIGQRYITKMVGVEITIPLYSGGLVKASSDQARATYEQAQFELQEKTNKVLLELRKQYNLCVSGLTRIDALQEAVDSATLLITATRKSAQAGMRTNLDILHAQQQLYQAKRDLARARYQHVLARLQLDHAAGTLTAQNLYDMAQWFVPPGQQSHLAAAGATARAVR